MSGKSQRTAAHVLETALALFRKRGFDATTMRDIAAGAGLSLGAAYYHFPSKDAILLAYYARREVEHRARVQAVFVEERDLARRLEAVLTLKLDVLRRDRKMLARMFGLLADPTHPLSAFGRDTVDIRDKGMALFGEALAVEPLPEDLRAFLTPALWAMHLGVLLYYVMDRSPKQARTRALVDGTVDLLVPLIRVSALPGMEHLRAQALRVMSDAGLSQPLRLGQQLGHAQPARGRRE